MRIQRLSTTHFRNLVHNPLSFSPGINLFLGDNAQGKTNVLEALSFFKIGRSFRASRDTDLVDFSEEFCRVESAVDKRVGGEVFSASIERNGEKRIKVDEREVDKLSDLVGLYPCVLFGPLDLYLVSGGPDERRRYLDITGSVTDRAYLDELRGYRRVLGQRNALLKATAPRSERSVWDGELVRRASAVIKKRTRLVGELGERVARHIKGLDRTSRVDLVYESDVAGELPDGVSREDLLAAELSAVEEEELRRKTTLIGPHRDDLRVFLDGRDVRRYGSQGERRLIAVLLRLAELSYLEERLREPCVLMLDDLFSELDDDVSTRLRALLEDDHQIFVTSPVASGWEREKTVRAFRVEKGRVSE